MEENKLFYYEICVSVYAEEVFRDEGRLMGIYDNFIDADECVKNNNGDIFEFTYRYAYINKVEYGLFPGKAEAFLYKYNFSTDKFDFVKSIDRYEDFVNYKIDKVEREPDEK